MTRSTEKSFYTNFLTYPIFSNFIVTISQESHTLYMYIGIHVQETYETNLSSAYTKDVADVPFGSNFHNAPMKHSHPLYHEFAVAIHIETLYQNAQSYSPMHTRLIRSKKLAKHLELLSDYFLAKFHSLSMHLDSLFVADKDSS